MSAQNRNGGEHPRARKTVDVTEEWLHENGRKPVNKLINGSLRTYMWANPDDQRIPPRFEHMRIYSVPNDYGTSRGLEASDMVHVIKSIDEVGLFARDMGWEGEPIPDVDARTVYETVLGFRRRRPKKTIVSRNVAVLVWVNEFGDELICKAEFFAVLEPGVVVRGFGVEQLDAVRRCYVKAVEFIDELHAELQKTTLSNTRRRR